MWTENSQGNRVKRANSSRKRLGETRWPMAISESREIEKFDRCAKTYNELMDASVRFSGEDWRYFAEYKITCLKRFGYGKTTRVLDFGCGTGNLTSLLCDHFGEVAGIDPSCESLARAREVASRATFWSHPDMAADSHFDVSVLAGVLHHVPLADRVCVVKQAMSKLRVNGRIVVFEHNPMNPLTRIAVEKCQFDDDAVLLRPSEVRSVLLSAGCSDIRQDYIVFFPKCLAWFRSLELHLRWLPVGAQTLTTAILNQNSPMIS